VDKITISSEEKVPGRVNINTAPKTVLAALLGGDDTADQIAENIITYRESLMYGMESIAEVMQVGSMNIDSFKKIVDFITTRSNVFTIRCIATTDRNGLSGATLETEAVVDRSSTPCKILYWYQGTSN
jgi:type II secretory pathway component PulK